MFWLQILGLGRWAEGRKAVYLSYPLLDSFSSGDKVKDFTLMMRENNKTIWRRLCRKKSHAKCHEIYFIGAAAWPEDLATVEEVKASRSQVRIGIDVLAPITKNLADYLAR